MRLAVSWIGGCIACGPRVDASASDDAGGGASDDSTGSADGTSGSASESLTASGSGSDTALPPDDGSSDSGPPPVEVERCPDVVAESMYCATTDGTGRVLVIGGDTGATCLLSEPELPGEHLEPSLVWDGDRIIGCSDSYLVRIDLVDDAVESIEVGCNRVAQGDGLLILALDDSPDAPALSVRRYADFAAAVAGAAEATFPGIPYWNAAAAVDDVLFVAGYSGNSVPRYSLADLSSLDDLPVIPNDGFAWGLSELGGDLFLLTTSEDDAHAVVRYDPSTGERLGSVPVVAAPGFLGGLACRPGA